MEWWIGGAVLAVVVGVVGPYAVGATGSARRRAAAALRPVRKVMKRLRRAVGKRERALDAGMRPFVEEQVQERMRRVSLEELREDGARNVRWGALEDAGFTSLADLARVHQARLLAVRGVGPKTAPRVAEAARRAEERVRLQPTELPGPEFEGAAGLRVARGALSALALRDVLGPEFAGVDADFTRLVADYRALAKRARFWSWLLRPGQRQAVRDELDAWTERLGERVDTPAWRHLTEVVRRLPRPRKKGKPDADRAGAAERYAEVCALLEESLRRIGQARADDASTSMGRLPAEIADRVEGFALVTTGLNGTLRGYQQFGAKYMLAQKRTIVGDEMGLGKTIEALAAMNHIAFEKPGARFFVVAPAGLIWNWARETEKWTPITPRVFHGDEAKLRLEEWAENGGLGVTSYATLRNLWLDGSLPEVDVDLFVADEAHYMKNPEARRTKAALAVVGRSEVASLLSGTPLENHPSEFVGLVGMLRPEASAELRRCLDEPRRFHREAAAIYLRRNQKDVLHELPDRIEVEEWVELHAQERAHYRAEVQSGDFMGMRRATTCSDNDVPSAKLERIEELVEEHRASGRKLIIFSYFLAVLRELERRFVAVGTIDGSVAPARRLELVDELGALEGHGILLAQIDAAGTGLNLQCASVVILVEPQLKPTVEDQAIARAHRMGQTERVVVHRLLARDTVDERLVDILSSKRDFFDAFARESAVTRESEEAVQTSLASQVIEAERRRLDLERAPGETLP